MVLTNTHLCVELRVRTGQPCDFLQGALRQNSEFLVRPLELMERGMDVILLSSLARSLHRGKSARMAVHDTGRHYGCEQAKLTDCNAGSIAAVEK